MHTIPPSLSAAARGRMLSVAREPLFIADWMSVVMIHLEVDTRELQAVTPYALDLWNGRSFVTLVAFSLRGMRPQVGGRVGELLFRPLAAHQFLNVRTYVRHDDETGIHFLAEWLDSRLAVRLGPRVFGLPYRLGRNEYRHDRDGRALHGRVVDVRSGDALEYHAGLEAGLANFTACAAGSLDEWLMERYTAFNCAGGRRRFFRVWHEPWPQVRLQAHLITQSLLTREWPFFAAAKLVGANYSPGVCGVWMGRPHRPRSRVAELPPMA